jgi:hypothetical protein
MTSRIMSWEAMNHDDGTVDTERFPPLWKFPFKLATNNMSTMMGTTYRMGK